MLTIGQAVENKRQQALINVCGVLCCHFPNDCLGVVNKFVVQLIVFYVVQVSVVCCSVFEKGQFQRL